MNKRNEDGFIQIIVYLLIFIVFSVTVYICLDVLDLIDVPEEYSFSVWLDEHMNDYKVEKNNEDTGIIKSIHKKIRGDKEDDKSSQVIVPPDLNIETVSNISYESDNTEINDYDYYNQLDKYGKIIYEEVEKNLDNMKSGTYIIDFGSTFNDLLHEENGEGILNNSFQLAINAISFDHPEVFYLEISKIYLLTRITTRLFTTEYTVTIGPAENSNYLNSTFNSESKVNEAVWKLENEKNKIIYNLFSDRSEIVGQIREVHDYLIENLGYDSTVSHQNIYNSYGALVNKLTVCEGYSRAFKYIMDNLNIPCAIICGTATNSQGQMENHAWNYVKIDGKWYAIDVTWDDPIIIGNGRIRESINYKYYLKGSSDFFTNHTEDGNIVGDSNFKYPVLSIENYK